MGSVGQVATSMDCRHCGTHFSQRTNGIDVGRDGEWRAKLDYLTCTKCSALHVRITRTREIQTPEESQGEVVTQTPRPGGGGPLTDRAKTWIWPQSTYVGLDQSIPADLQDLFREARGVLEVSPRASAALSRHCLQRVLRDHAKVNPGNLSKEIDDALAKHVMPSTVQDALHALREVGNLAAHPTKDQTSGSVVDVEPGEAEWNLETLLLLFDFFFVQPARQAARKQQLNQKLKAAGRKSV